MGRRVRSQTVSKSVEPVSLRRTLTLPMVVLYGLGVTIGAGIYVLVGEAAGHAGMAAPISFIIAGLVMICPAASFAELAGRLPFAAGEARFVEEAFSNRRLTLLIGLAVACVGIVSSAAIALGSTGYIVQIIRAPETIVLVAVVIIMGAVAAWGIKESIAVAGLLTVIEGMGLIAIILGAVLSNEDYAGRLNEIIPPASTSEWQGIAAASLLAFFAFIGFEDIDSLAEETQDPQRTLAHGIFITLGISMLLYVAVSAVAVLAVPPETLAASKAPLADVFAHVTRFSPLMITLIAIVATLNGVVVQIIMTSRVLYGLANRNYLPHMLAKVNPVTRTPLIATGIAVGIVLLLALAFPIGELAEWTSRLTLGVFVVVCAALVRIKRRGSRPPSGTLIVPMWVPIVGAALCLGLLLLGG
jgi:basic amino acid/polyamine antiporter, APA family